MRRSDLDHLLRAAGDLTGHKRFVLVGSNAILAWHSTVPRSMSLSRDADMFASDVDAAAAEGIADLLENIGHLSVFDDTHGYYADGVEPHTAVLPADWRERGKAYASPATNGVEAIVPHPDDIAISKLYAGRAKDTDWVAVAHRAGLVDLGLIARRIETMEDVPAERRARMLELVEVARRTQGA